METLETFDWVTARGKCSTEQMLMRLAEVIESDVAALRSAKLRHNIFALNVDKSYGKVYVGVTLDYGGIPQSAGVRFQLDHDILRITHVRQGKTDELKFSLRASLFPDGKCRFHLGGQPDAVLELWQVSRMALEPIFFGE